MSEEANRNAQSLSRHNPSRIKELQHVISQNGGVLGIRAHELLQSNFSDGLLTGAGVVLYCCNS
jgi:hypothetical protein